MWRNIATMIYGWHEQIQPGGAGGEYTLVRAHTRSCLDTVELCSRKPEMHRHGSRGKELSSHGGRVATVSSGIEKL